MFDKLTGLSQELYFLCISLMFGIGSFLFKVRQDELKSTKFNFISELFFASLAGYLSFKLGLYFNFSINMISIFVGIASFSGTKFLLKLEYVLAQYIDNKYISADKVKDSPDVEK